MLEWWLRGAGTAVRRYPTSKDRETPANGRHWSSYEEIPHAQGQRKSPSKTVGAATLHLESNPIPVRGLKQTLCAPEPRDPTETETELCLSVSYGDTGQQWTATGAGTLGAGDLGIA